MKTLYHCLILIFGISLSIAAQENQGNKQAYNRTEKYIDNHKSYSKWKGYFRN